MKPKVSPTLPTELVSCLDRANSHFKAGELEPARDQLKKALQITPDAADILASLGSIEFQLGNLAPAAAALSRAAELQPKNASVLTRLAVAHLQQNQVEQFESNLAKALEADPNYVDALLLLANLNRDMERWSEAVKIYSRILQLQPPDSNVLLALSKCYFGLKDLGAAKSLCDMVLHLEPENAIAKDNLAILQKQISDAAAKAIVVMESPALSYAISITNEGPEATFELSVDIYPEDNPGHPKRHYGHWNKVLPLQSGKTVAMKVLWAPATKQVSFDKHPADHAWVGDFSEPGCYRVNFALFKDQKRIQLKHHLVHIERALPNQEFPVRFFVGKESQLLSAVWMINPACNYKCPYCWGVHRQHKGTFKPEPFLPADKWIEAWNRLRPALLNISGGEPFLQPNFIYLLEQLHDSVRVAITTNLSQDMTQFVQKLSPEKICSMTLSWHPTEKQSLDTFLGKCLLLKNRGYALTVNFVTWPEQIWLLPYYKEVFEKNGLRFHVDPYNASPETPPYQFSEKELDLVRQYVGSDRERLLGIGVDNSPVLCSAGYNHLQVQPNGDAYCCLHHKFNNRGHMGNIMDPHFQLYSEWKFCSDFAACLNCDRDHIQYKRVTGKAPSGCDCEAAETADCKNERDGCVHNTKAAGEPPAAHQGR
jgi:tetratricopeptide (TPR) repeat protein